MRPGYWAAIAVSTLAFAPVVIGVVSSSAKSTKYGRVSIPGSEALHFPSGEVLVYYEEHVQLDENEHLDAPGGLRLRVGPTGGGREVPLTDKDASFAEVGIGSTTRTTIGSLDVPEDGDYRVTAGPRLTGVDQPAMTFGAKGSFVLWAIVGGVVLALAGLIALVTWLRGRGEASAAG